MAEKVLTAQEALALMKSEFKQSTSVLMSEESAGTVKTWIDMNVCALNWIVSGDLTRGFPFGRCIEYHGDNSTGKTLLALACCAFTQKIKGLVFYYDPECSVDKEFARKLGVDPEQMVYNDKLDTIEQFEQELEQLIRIKEVSKSDQPFLVVLDSLAMLSTEHEMENPDKEDMGKKAKAMKQITRRLTRKLSHNNIGVLILNHLMANIQINPFLAKFAPAKVTTGGSAVPYLASARLETKIGNKIKDKKTDEVDGVTIYVNCMKNKLARPYRKCAITFNLKLNMLEKYSGLPELLLCRDIIEKKKIGAKNYYAYKGEEFVCSDFPKMVEKHGWIEEFNKALKDYDAANKDEIITDSENVSVEDIDAVDENDSEDTAVSVNDKLKEVTAKGRRGRKPKN